MPELALATLGAEKAQTFHFGPFRVFCALPFRRLFRAAFILGSLAKLDLRALALGTLFLGLSFSIPLLLFERFEAFLLRDLAARFALILPLGKHRSRNSKVRLRIRAPNAPDRIFLASLRARFGVGHQALAQLDSGASKLQRVGKVVSLAECGRAATSNGREHEGPADVSTSDSHTSGHPPS